MTIRAVLFDLGDTIIRIDPWPEDFPTRLGHFLREHAETNGIDHHSVAGRMSAAITQELIDAHHAGHTTEVDIGELLYRHSSALEVLLRVTAGEPGRRLYGEADIERFHLPDGRHEIFDALRSQGLKLGIISNTSTPPDMMTAYLREAGLAQYFDTLVFSSGLGLKKPHRAIFESALAALDEAPEDAVYIGDRIREDVRGPGAIGMRGILTHEFRQEEHQGEPFAVLSHLGDIITVASEEVASAAG